MRRIVLMLLVWMSCWPCAQATNDAPRWLVVGDSLAAGYGVIAGRGWVELMADRLDGRVMVINASVSGETSSGGRARLPALLADHQPVLVIIELGANDGLRGFALTDTRANLEAMIDASLAVGAQVLLVGIELPVNYGARYRAEFRDLYAELAAEHQLPFVPFLLDRIHDDPDYFQADQIHPNERAQPLLLETVWQVAESLLPAPRD